MKAGMKRGVRLAVLGAAISTVVVLSGERTTVAAPPSSPVSPTVVNPASQPVPSAIDASANVVRLRESVFNARKETGIAAGGNESRASTFSSISLRAARSRSKT